MHPLVRLVISFALVAFSRSDDDGNKRLQLTVSRHQPCIRHSPPSELIRFSNNTDAPVQPDDERGSGCYTISGPVTIKQTIRGVVQIYVEAKSGPSTESHIEQCHGADKNNCGGVGSCVYCSMCKSIDTVEKKSSAMIKVQHDGKALDCDNGVQPGTYNNIKLSFCMPTKEEFLKAEGYDEAMWNSNVEDGHAFFLMVYIFNTTVNTLPATDLRNLITKNTNVIGCHKIVGNLYNPS